MSSPNLNPSRGRPPAPLRGRRGVPCAGRPRPSPSVRRTKTKTRTTARRRTKPKGKDAAKPVPQIDVTKLLKAGKSHDWTLTGEVNVSSWVRPARDPQARASRCPGVRVQLRPGGLPRSSAARLPAVRTTRSSRASCSSTRRSSRTSRRSSWTSTPAARAPGALGPQGPRGPEAQGPRDEARGRHLHDQLAHRVR